MMNKFFQALCLFCFIFSSFYGCTESVEDSGGASEQEISATQLLKKLGVDAGQGDCCDNYSCWKRDTDTWDIDGNGEPDAPSWCDGYWKCNCWGGCTFNAPQLEIPLPDGGISFTVCPRPGGNPDLTKCCEGDYWNDPKGSGYCIHPDSICKEDIPPNCANLNGTCREVTTGDPEDACLDDPMERARPDLPGCLPTQVCCVSAGYGEDGGIIPDICTDPANEGQFCPNDGDTDAMCTGVCRSQVCVPEVRTAVNTCCNSADAPASDSQCYDTGDYSTDAIRIPIRTITSAGNRSVARATAATALLPMRERRAASRIRTTPAQ